jgi:hypothetical protein
MILYLLIFRFLLLSLFGPQEKESIYSNPQYWYFDNTATATAVTMTPKNEKNSFQRVKKYNADVFYIAPTCVWDWKDSTGTIMHYSSRLKAEHRAALEPSLKLAKEIFGDSCNFYSPYYRQITLESWKENDSIIESRFALSMKDVQESFNYYMEHLNNGHPFIIAGFSQGGKCVVELLKSLNHERYSKLVAAYVIGYRVTEKELMEYPDIVPAKDSIDTGVTICYNSAGTPETVLKSAANSAICINPVNWHSDSTPAYLVLDENAVRPKDKPKMIETATIAVDTLSHTLIVSNIDSSNYFFPQLSSFFPKGNYHLQELVFYKNCLNKNVKQRVAKFRSAGKHTSK